MEGCVGSSRTAFAGGEGGAGEEQQREEAGAACDQPQSAGSVARVTIPISSKTACATFTEPG